MGVFWFVGGLMSLRWGATGERAQRTSIVVGIVGIVAGVLVLGRFLLIDVLGETPIALLSWVSSSCSPGWCMCFEGIRTGPGHQRQRSWTSTLAGRFRDCAGRSGTGVADDFGPIFYRGASVWAFLGAFVLLREALKKRAETH